MARWAKQWLVSFNPFKNESLLISRKTNKPDHPSIFMSGQIIKEVDTHKHLGIFLSYLHIDYIKTKAWARINIMRKLKFQLDHRSLEIIYTSFIRTILEYGNEIWDNCTQYEKEELDKIQNEAARIAMETTKLISIETLYSEIGWEKKVREKSRECHNHKPQPFPDTKRKRKSTNLNKHKPNKRMKSTKISSLYPKRGNRNTKRTEKHKNKMTHGKIYNKSPLRINHKATKSKTNTGTTALELSVEQTTGEFKALLQLANFTLGNPRFQKTKAKIISLLQNVFKYKS